MDNIMLEHVSGEYSTWCDSDDVMLPGAIKYISTLIAQIPKKKEKNYFGIFAQNVDRFNKSQTFYENNIPKELKHLTWECLSKITKGDATIIGRSEILKGKKFLEVDFVITEISYFEELFKGKKFIVTPLVVKVMDRSAENSISFGKKLSYSRGSAYCIAKIETSKNFSKHSFFKKIKIMLNFWRYTIHGDINFIQAKKILDPANKNIFYSLLYIFAIIICLRDHLYCKVEKTHIEFEKNIKKKRITVKRNN
jgi:hypothetical protein